jgi:hypothetical protein
VASVIREVRSNRYLFGVGFLFVAILLSIILALPQQVSAAPCTSFGLVNASFEEPTNFTNFTIIDESLVPGWETTATDDKIELWKSGFQSVPSQEGNQHAELNANQSAALFQDTTTTPGDELIWSLYHRGRSGSETMELLIGPAGSLVSQGQFTTGTGAWVEYSGTYVVPAGQTTTRFQFESLTGGGSGNFLDNITFQCDPNVDSDGDGAFDVDEGTGDRDGDSIDDASDFDPTGYFYCRDTGEILTGGSISVAGPGAANIILDGSSGQYQWTVAVAGVYTMTLTPPAGTSIDIAFRDLANLDPTAQPNPFVLGPGQNGGTGFLANLPVPFPTTFFVNFDLAAGDPIIINNNIPLTGGACAAPAAAPAVGGDPPIWENIMVFPTPEKFEGRDLNNDGDMNDAVLRYKNLDSGAITNTGIAVSQNHRDIDIYGDNIVFVSRDDSLFSQVRGLFTPYGWIGVYNIKTNQTTMLNVWGDRPSIYENLVSISGTELRFYDLNTSRMVETDIEGTNQAVWGDFIAYEAADDTICLYEISTGEVIRTGTLGAFPTIHENIVAFENNRELLYYDIERKQVVETGLAGKDAVVYGDHIVYSNGKKIFYYDVAEGQAYSTGKSGLEPDIYEDTITYYVWEDWKGADINSDGDRQDPIVNTFTISDSDVAVRMTSANEVESAAIYSIQGSLDAQGVTFKVNGTGIESAELEVYALDGRAIFDSGFVSGNKLRWNLRRHDGAVLANGVYLYRVLVRGVKGEVIHSEIRKMLILR